ncbi:DivIVA domain-containing protein [Gemmiger formicilis]|uniref:DivIVA domain-containing protein n=3 Tax=Eubacteriales TaxID=186802 RepID=A0A943HGG0_9FIRM|nr:DivIVA domain-containing protein [Gemmiger formicilis]MBS5330918.1 DivIVA domain-containing protein [Subdoligranulum variabile]MBT9674165.1 DivIVA domain-containing protein [Gemmiger formicilis]
MISSEDVRRVTFDKAFQGYRREDVDAYLKEVAQAMDDLAAQNDDLQKKLVVLAQRIDQYRAEEDTLRTTMINAQRLGENVIREAKQKAAEIIRTANIKAEDREQRSRDDVELAKQEIVTLKSEADSFKRSLIEMYRKHINLINKLPDYTPQPEDPPVRPMQPAAEPAPAPVQAAPVEQPAVEPTYTPPAAQPAPEPIQPPMQETAYYEEPAPAPEAAAPAGEKVDTVEFAIAPHPEEPEEIAPTPIPEAPAIDESRFQDISGLYDEPEAKPARRRKASTTTKRTTRKKASAEPQEELNSPAFDNFEGVDFDS